MSVGNPEGHPRVCVCVCVCVYACELLCMRARACVRACMCVCGFFFFWYPLLITLTDRELYIQNVLCGRSALTPENFFFSVSAKVTRLRNTSLDK